MEKRTLSKTDVTEEEEVHLKDYKSKTLVVYIDEKLNTSSVYDVEKINDCTQRIIKFKKSLDESKNDCAVQNPECPKDTEIFERNQDCQVNQSMVEIDEENGQNRSMLDDFLVIIKIIKIFSINF